MEKALFSTGNGEWETPDDLFSALNLEYNFDLDVCATPHNAKCKRYFSKNQDGLSQEWRGNIWCNPPYGREIDKWIAKAVQSYQSQNCSRIVMLLPARTDTKWIHEHIFKKADVIFLKGRLKFKNSEGVCNSAPFPSMLAVFDNSPKKVRFLANKLGGHAILRDRT